VTAGRQQRALRKSTAQSACDPEETSAIQMAVTAESQLTDIRRIVTFAAEASPEQPIAINIAKLA
jgi:hypothetical protein